MQTLDNSHYIEGFLIGTKKNANGWQVSKQTLPQLVNAFIGKPFTIIPQKLEHNIDAHFHGATKQETIDGYAAYSHGTIEKIIGPLPYNDDTDDFYYKHITKLSNSKSASLLAEYGAKSKVPFSVSPHIWHEDVEITDYVSNFTPIGISLVAEGAYGSIAVINRLCEGSADTCHRSLGAASNCGCGGSCDSCANTDENIAKILSSHFSKSASVPTIMSINNDITNTTPSAVTTPPINSTNTPTQQQLTQEPTASDKIVLTKEQYDLIQQERKEFESTKSRLTILEDTHKTSVLNNIFTADLITDETTRNNLVDKWKKFDVVMVQDLYQDFTASLVPALIEKARKDAETAAALATAATTAATPPATNKSKSAALKPEPKIEEDKAASVSEIEPVKINEVALLRKYLFGGANP